MWTAGALLSLCLSTTALEEGVLCLKDGRIFEGLKMRREGDSVVVDFENGEVAVPSHLIQDALVGGESTYVPTTEEEKAKWEQGLVPFEGKWVKESKRRRELEKRVEELRERVEEMQSYRKWRSRRTEKTKHFEFEYTVPQHIYEYYRDLMEEYFSAFAKDWKIKMPKDGRLKVCFYRNREDFNQISGAGGGVVGYFRYVKPWELNIFYERTDPQFTENVLFHEANHYLQKLIDPEFKMPHFPGESIAEYYGGASYDPDKGKVTYGLILEGRLTEVQTDIAAGTFMGLKEMILSERDYKHYTWGWTLVHYLMNQSQYEKKFVKFAMALAKGSDVDRRREGFNLNHVQPAEIWKAFQRYMGLKNDEDVAEMQREWHDYVQNQMQLVSTRGLEKAAMAAARQYPPRPLRAKRLFSEAIAQGTENPLTYHKYAELLVRHDKKYDEALALWTKAVNLDPLNATYYASMGRTLAQKGQSKEGKRLVALAREIEPDVDDDVWGIINFN